ncbi:Protein AsmA, partial [human gut metagenome]
MPHTIKKMSLIGLAQWQESHKRLSFNQISLTANDSTLSGQAQVTLTEKPEWQL